MAKLIISAVSQLSNGPTLPPKFAVETNPNEMPASKEKAPVLLSIASAGTVEADEFAERFAGKCSHLDVIEAIRRINALGEVLAECAADCTNVQLGYVNLEVSVSGTVPDTNAPLNDANEAFYSAVPSEKLRKQFAALETHIPVSVCPANLKRVRDVATGDNCIHDCSPFFYQGENLTHGGEGEKVELFDEKRETKICDVIVLNATSKVSVMAKLSKSVKSGRYYLMVTTLAGGEKTLWPIGCFTQVIGPAVPPTPTLKVTSAQTGGENEVKLFTDDILIEGTEVEKLTDAYLELYDTHGEFVARMQHMGESRVERIDGTHVKYYIRGNTSTAIDAQWEPGEGVVKLVISRRDAENLVVPITVK